LKPETSAWMKKAEEDLNLASFVLKSDEQFINSACFHAQQASEKYLKSILQEKGADILKTHDMMLLTDAAGKFVPEITAIKQKLAALTVYAVAARYPFEDAQKEDALEAIETASICRMIIRKFLGLK